MTAPKTFLLVDSHAETRYLLAKTLLRKFPEALIRECDDLADAARILKTETVTAVVSHRTSQEKNIDIVRHLRSIDSRVPIVMVSGIDREPQARAAGASAFLHPDERLRIGSILEEQLQRAGLGDVDGNRVA